MPKNNRKEIDELANAKAQGQAQFDSIKDMVEALENGKRKEENDDHSQASEAAESAIHDDALSIQVRSGWYQPGAGSEERSPAEYEILLCTGGPACRLIGKLDHYGQPDTCRMEVQDWFQPWTEFRPHCNTHTTRANEAILLAYARCFYFGEG